MDNVGHRWRNTTRRTCCDYLKDVAVYAVIALLFIFGFWATSAQVDDERIRPDARAAVPKGHTQR